MQAWWTGPKAELAWAFGHWRKVAALMSIGVFVTEAHNTGTETCPMNVTVSVLWSFFLPYLISHRHITTD